MNLEERKDDFVKLVCEDYMVFDGTDMNIIVRPDRIILETTKPNGLLSKFGSEAQVRFFLFANKASIIFKMDGRFSAKEKQVYDYFMRKWWDNGDYLPDGRCALIEMANPDIFEVEFEMSTLFSIRGSSNSAECLLRHFIMALSELQNILGAF